MTPKAVELVQGSWKKVLPIADTAAAIFYTKLFELDPAATDRAVCACFKVTESAIRSAVAGGATLARLQKDLKCGTNCGSCFPELQRLLAA